MRLLISTASCAAANASSPESYRGYGLARRPDFALGPHIVFRWYVPALLALPIWQPLCDEPLADQAAVFGGDGNVAAAAGPRADPIPRRLGG
jgi:hypothetical protein